MAVSGTGFDADLWKGFVEQGIAGLIVGEEHGGLGLSVLDAAVAAEALGYGAAPIAFAGSLVMAPLALRLSAPLRSRTSGCRESPAAMCASPSDFAGWSGQTGRADVTLQAGRLTGKLHGALDAGGATHVIVVLSDGRIALAGPGQMAASPRRCASLDPTRPVTDIAFEKSAVVVLKAAERSSQPRMRVLDAGRVMLAADTLGAGQAMIDKAVAYAKERVQFGRRDRLVPGRQAYSGRHRDATSSHAGRWSGMPRTPQDAMPDEARLTALHAKAHLGDVGRRWRG